MLPESMLAATYVTLPSLEVRERSGQKSVHNELLGTHVDASPELLAVLDRFRTPKPLGKVLAESSLSPDDVLVEVAFGRARNGDDLVDVHRQPLELADHELGQAATFVGTVPLGRSGSFGYNVRVTPRHALLANPAELGLVAVAH